MCGLVHRHQGMKIKSQINMYIPLTPSEETALIGFSVHQVITYLTKVFPSEATL